MGPGEYWFYDRILTPAQQLDPAYDIYRVARLWLHVDPNDPRITEPGMDYFLDFQILPEFQHRHVTGYHTAVGLVSDQWGPTKPTGGIYPLYPVEVNLNEWLGGRGISNPDVFGGNTWNPVAFNVPTMVARPLMSTKQFLPVISSPKFVVQIMDFQLPIVDMVIDTDFGMDGLPCIASRSKFVTPDITQYLREDLYKQLLALSPMDQLAKLFEWHRKEFTDPLLTNVAPMGWFRRETGPDGNIRMRLDIINDFRPRYDPSDPSKNFYGTAGLKCYYYLPIKKGLPTNHYNVKHTFHLNMAPTGIVDFNPAEEFYYYGSYSRMVTNSHLETASAITP